MRSFGKQQCVHDEFPQQFSCSKYQDIEEVVPRKLYKAWDHVNQAMVALKLVEVYVLKLPLPGLITM